MVKNLSANAGDNPWAGGSGHKRVGHSLVTKTTVIFYIILYSIYFSKNLISKNWVKISSLVGKEFAWNAGDLGLIPGLGRSPGGGHGNPLQFSYMENPHEQRSLASYSPCGCKESYMTERLHLLQNIQSSLCYRVGSWCLSILNMCVTCQSPTP